MQCVVNVPPKDAASILPAKVKRPARGDIARSVAAIVARRLRPSWLWSVWDFADADASCETHIGRDQPTERSDDNRYIARRF